MRAGGGRVRDGALRSFRDKAALIAAVSDHDFAALRECLVAADARPDACEALVAQGFATIERSGRLAPAEAAEIETALRLFVDGLGVDHL